MKAAGSVSLRHGGQACPALPFGAEPRRWLEDYGVAALLTGGVLLAFLRATERAEHWFVVPVAACGILAGADIVRWLRGRQDLFDPRTIIACLAFYGFFIAPLLHVLWDLVHVALGEDDVL